jgi:unsaturated rhamnogalacturonyl hydrolase
MKNSIRTVSVLLAATLLLPAFSLSAKPKKTKVKIKKAEVVQFIENVNDYYQTANSKQGWAFWDIAAYHTGNIAAYEITKKEQYKQYSVDWSEKNEWKGAKSDNKEEWKYSYGERDNFVLFGDWQICFQTYIDLYNMDEVKDERKIARAREVMEYQMSTPQNDYWWWADGLYMVMPVMTKLYNITGNQQYLDKLYEYYMFAEGIMYDEAEGLFFRDAKYVYPKHKSLNGKKDFWARGDGWVFAGFAKVLADLPQTDAQRDHYIKRYKEMAVAIAKSQQSEGYWTRSILDPEHAPGPETSGTAFFTYGLLWGINNGYLDAKTYLPVALKAWSYLNTTALQPDGKIGYVQPIGERAIPGQVVDKNSTSGFGVGAVLLAASEMYKMAK